MTLGPLFTDGRPLSIGPRIGRGGEGAVYALSDDASSAVKIYSAGRKEREPKISAMIAAELASKSTLASFPNAIVRNREREFLGFRMRLVRDHKPLHDLYAPGSRKHNFPQADYRFLVRAATNLAAAVADVHSSGCVIGDLNHSGVLVSPKAMVSLIDADSFQFAVGSKIFHCKVGVPEYTPPELQGKPLGNIIRTPNHDCFGLAVIIFQLLFMGRHPFVGTVRNGEIPPLHEAIRDFRFVYTDKRNVGMDQPPGTPSLAEFSSDIGGYFEAAFGRSTKESRPSASDWFRALEALEASLVPCSENKIHYAPRDADECPWCYMEEQLGTMLFVPFVPGAKLIDGVDPGAAAFDIQTIWKQISAVSIPQRAQLLPKLAVASLPSSPKAQPSFFAEYSLPKIVCALAAVGVLIFAPQLWVLSILLAGYVLFASRSSNRSNTSAIREELSRVQKRWFAELIAWQSRIGVDDFVTLQGRLAENRDEYLRLEARKRDEIAAYRSQRRQKQLLAFLDNFEIRRARIKGIGPAKQAALASYGLDTAADITLAKALAVPGIGDAIAQDLLNWRAACERRFIYSETSNQADLQELANISMKYAMRAASLRRTLSAGPANLSALSKRIMAAATIEEPLLSSINAERERLKAKFGKLGIAPPDYPFDWSKLNRTTSTQPSGLPASSSPPASPLPTRSTSTSSTMATPSCPRCASTMVRRVARRGRNAGGSFWGCSRFPVCRGTRSI